MMTLIGYLAHALATLALAYAFLVLAGIMLMPGFAVEPVGCPESGDCYIVMGFGLGETPNGQKVAGKSNRDLARFLLDANVDAWPAVVQHGVWLALCELQQEAPAYADRNLDWVVPLPHDSDFHVDTRTAALQSLALLHYLGRASPILVAHPDQLKRVAFLLAHLPVEGAFIVPEMCPVRYDLESEQVWTRRRIIYCSFELFVSRPRSILEAYLF